LKRGIDSTMRNVRLITRATAFLHNFIMRRNLERNCYDKSLKQVAETFEELSETDHQPRKFQTKLGQRIISRGSVWHTGRET
jgi:hypothetical protein